MYRYTVVWAVYYLTCISCMSLWDKEMTRQRCISLSCWVGTRLEVRQEELEIGRKGQQTDVLRYAAPQSQAVACQQGWGVSAASVKEEGHRTEVCCDLLLYMTNFMLIIWYHTCMDMKTDYKDNSYWMSNCCVKEKSDAGFCMILSSKYWHTN